MLLRLSSCRPVSFCTDVKPEIGNLRHLEIQLLQGAVELGGMRAARRSKK